MNVHAVVRARFPAPPDNPLLTAAVFFSQAKGELGRRLWVVIGPIVEKLAKKPEYQGVYAGKPVLSYRLMFLALKCDSAFRKAVQNSTHASWLTGTVVEELKSFKNYLMNTSRLGDTSRFFKKPSEVANFFCPAKRPRSAGDDAENATVVD